MEAMAQRLSVVQTQLNDVLASGTGGANTGHYQPGKPDPRNTPLVPTPVPSLSLPRPDMSPLAADDAGHYHSLSVGRQRVRHREHPAHSPHSHNQHQQLHDRDRSGEDRARPHSQPHSQQSHSHSQDDDFDLDEDPILEAAALAPMAKMRGIADTRRASVTSPERPAKRLRGVSNGGGGGVDEYGGTLPSIAAAVGPPTLADDGRGVDPVEIGLCSAGRGRQLVAAYVSEELTADQEVVYHGC